MVLQLGVKQFFYIFAKSLIVTELHSDVMGLACSDYLAGQKSAKIKVKSDIAEDDVIPVAYLFRSFDDMPAIEQQALRLCSGSILDIGAGAGSHALWLQQNGADVTAFDISPGLCQTMVQRGLVKVVEGDFFNASLTQKYDTLLMLMNGIGFVGKLDKLGDFFARAKTLLKPGGQMILDSCDIAYLFDDEETEHLPETFDHYYGELRYQMIYKQHRGARFGWLFIDPKMLAHLAGEYGWQCEVVMQCENGSYLAQLAPMNQSSPV